MSQVFRSIPGERFLLRKTGFSNGEVAANIPGVIFVLEKKLEAPHQRRLKLRKPNPEPVPSCSA